MSELLHRALKSAPASARYKRISPENESEIRHVTRSPLKSERERNNDVDAKWKIMKSKRSCSP